MRALLDAGAEGGPIDRADGEFPVFFPCAIAMRGQIHDVPLSILSRSYVLPMVKGVPKKRFDRKNPGPDFLAASELIEKWKATAVLNPDPDMPESLLKDGRVSDKCRPLIAIADSFGEDCGKAARAALVELNRHLPHQNPAIAALNACKAVFDAAGVDRMKEDWDRGYMRSEIERAWRIHCSESTGVAPGQRGRLIFALDATQSRQPGNSSKILFRGPLMRSSASQGRAKTHRRSPLWSQPVCRYLMLPEDLTCLSYFRLSH
jgi:hypothetical protein